MEKLQLQDLKRLRKFRSYIDKTRYMTKLGNNSTVIERIMTVELLFKI